MKKLSTLFLHEIEGYLFGLTFFGLLIGTSIMIQSRTFDQDFKNILNFFDLIILTMFAVLYRMWVIAQPRRSHAHIAHVFDVKKGKAWEIQGVVEKMVDVSPSDEHYQNIIKNLAKVPGLDGLQNQYVCEVKYSHVTVIGDPSFEFKTAVFLMDTERSKLYTPMPHEMLYKGFAAQVPCAFLSLDLLRLHKVEADKEEGISEEYIPVFLVRKSHYHSKWENLFKSLPQAADMEALKTSLVETITVVNLEKKFLEREEKGRKEGVEIGKDIGAAADKYLNQVIEPSLPIPSIREHKKAYLAFIGLTAMILAATYLLGWIRL